MSALEKMDRPECDCAACVELCEKRPCWGTPAEISRLIDAGWASSLMEDYWANGFGDGEDVPIISPALRGSEGKGAPWWPSGPCVLLADGLCRVHDIKPTEGAVAICKEVEGGRSVHKLVARTWDTGEGRDVVKLWRLKVGLDPL